MASAEIEANRQLAGQWRSSGGPWLASVYAFAERCVRAGRRGSEAGNRGPCHMGSAAVFIRRGPHTPRAPWPSGPLNLSHSQARQTHPTSCERSTRWPQVGRRTGAVRHQT
eukprot:2610607-Rhodomonas_salina.2